MQAIATGRAWPIRNNRTAGWYGEVVNPATGAMLEDCGHHHQTRKAAIKCAERMLRERAR